MSFWRRVPVFRDHPPGLGVCFLVEMWERFSYYGMRALLIFYLTQHFLFSDSRAFVLYGAYASMVYLLPVLGGAVAEQVRVPKPRNKKASVCTRVATNLTLNQPFSACVADGTSRAR